MAPGTDVLAHLPTAEAGASMPFPVSSAHLTIDELRAYLLKAVKRVCPHWLANEAEDLTQIAATRALGRLQATGGATEITKGYLYRIAFSVVIDEIRRRQRQRETALEPDDPVPSQAASPERQARAREVREAIVHCLTGMNPPRRRAVTLHLVGHSLGEIAKLLGCDQKKAENLVYRGLADLRAGLTAQGVAP